MKKMMFLVLTLFVLGAANVNAQVQIGGTKGPDKSAVLDLNPDAGDAKGGLALPRVELENEQSTLNGVEPQPGTVVYNTGSAQLAAGTYVWTKVDGGSSTMFSGISVDNTGTGTTVTGNGTDAFKLKVSVKNLGIDSEQIKDAAVTAAKIKTIQADSGKILYSDGKNVFWRYSGVPYFTTVDSVPVNSITATKAVTWTLTYQTALGGYIEPNTNLRFQAPGVTSSHWCRSSTPELVVAGFTQYVYVTNTYSVRHTLGTIQCFKPTF